MVLGPGPSNEITALFLQDAQLEESRGHQQASPAVVPMASNRAYCPVHLPGPSGTHALPFGSWGPGKSSLRSGLEGPPLARNCPLYFVKYFIIVFFFPSLSLVGTVTPALLGDRSRARDPCWIPPKQTSPKVTRPDDISSSVGGRLGTQGALGSQHLPSPCPRPEPAISKAGGGFPWVPAVDSRLDPPGSCPPHLPSLPVLRSSAGAAGPLVG